MLLGEPTFIEHCTFVPELSIGWRSRFPLLLGTLANFETHQYNKIISPIIIGLIFTNSPIIKLLVQSLLD